MLNAFLFLLVASAQAEPVYHLELKDRKIIPSEIHIKADEAFWLEIENKDNTSEEVESNSLHFEKVVPPKRTVKIKIAKASPGTHDIYGEFHPTTSKASIIAEDEPKK